MYYQRRRPAATWTELPEAEAAKANYWRVSCLACGFETVKASQHNTQLARRDHARRCTESSTVTPMLRTEKPKAVAQ